MLELWQMSQGEVPGWASQVGMLMRGADLVGHGRALLGGSVRAKRRECQSAWFVLCLRQMASAKV